MATILKSNEPVVPAQTARAALAGFNLDDFAEAGARHLRQVEAEAARILETAQTEAEAIRKRAAESGRREGLKAAEDEVREKIRSGIESEVTARMPVLESALRQISEIEQTYLEQFRDTLTTAVIAATERVVLARLEREPEVIERWAAAAIESTKSARRLVVAVHPETLVVHGESLERLLAMPGVPEDARIEPDESVQPAGVVVRLDGGSVQWTVDGALERLDEMLRGEA